MYCKTCGEQLPDGARFCRDCGTPVDSEMEPEAGPPVIPSAETPVAPPSAPLAPPPVPVGAPSPAGPTTGGYGAGGYSASGPGGPGGYGPGGPGAAGPGAGFGYPPPPRGRSNRVLWVVIAALAVVVVALAVALPLVLARGGDDEQVTETTAAGPTTTTSLAEETSTTVGATSTTSTTATTVAAGPVGDSSGEWAEMTIPGLPGELISVAVSNDGLVVQSMEENAFNLYAHSFASGSTVQLPTGTGEVGGVDVDKNIAVWWEGTYDSASGAYSDQHIYSYAFPEGPKVEIVGGDQNVGYPQIAGIWATWIVGTPWEVNPDEYWRMPIYGAFVSVGSGSANEPQALAPSAIGSILGDAVWTYSLSETYLAWEQGAAADGFDTGTYVLDLMNPDAAPVSLGSGAWRPSLSLDNVAYWEDGLKVANLSSGEKMDIDAGGDFPALAPTYVAYFVSTDNGYQIVARGLSGGHEQVLAEQTDAPWLSAAISACGQYVAFISNGSLHVFEWKAK